MPPSNSLSVTHTSTVTPEQIDELGHMNVRWYGANAITATAALCERLEVGAPALTSTYTRHHHEQLEGSELEVRSGVVGGTDQLRFFHELRNQATDQLAATFIHDLDYPLLEMATVQLPDYGSARTIDLSVDPLASAPTLEEVQRRDLATRLERVVTTEDSMGADVVPSWLLNNLLWGGERADGATSWIVDTADGDRVAFASMETRIQTRRAAAVGTRVQTFGVAIAVGKKILHALNWVYDLSTTEILAVAETVDLAFSISKRRSLVMPPEVRAREEQRLHPDFAERFSR